MSDAERRSNPLVKRVDALLRRHRDPAARATDVPVLTEVVDDDARRRPAVTPETLETLAHELERALLARLGPEVVRVIEQKLSRVLSSSLVGQSVDGMRAELTQSVTQLVREAIAASMARALAPNPAPTEKK
jgi:AcrR family transcriptional regulator